MSRLVYEGSTLVERWDTDDGTLTRWDAETGVVIEQRPLTDAERTAATPPAPPPDPLGALLDALEQATTMTDVQEAAAAAREAMQQ